MRIKTILALVLTLCLALLVACQSVGQGPISVASAPEDDTTSVPELGITFQGGYDVFARKYIDPTEDCFYGMEIVGVEATDKWVNDVYLKQSPKEMDALPALYQMIKYFSIPKEAMVELSDSYKAKGHDAMVMPRYVIEALYVDEKTMMKALVSPLALYHNGMVSTINELRHMTADEIRKTGIPPEELRRFAERIDPIIRENVGDKLYELEYKDFIVSLKMK